MEWLQRTPVHKRGGVSIQKSVKLIEIIFTHAIVLKQGNYRSHTEYIITHESQKYKKRLEQAYWNSVL